MPNLKIDDIVNVVVSTSGVATPRNGFNVGLIVGKSTAISKADRCKVFTDTDAMLEAGFTADSEEYKAATLYFSQKPRPAKLVVGCIAISSGETYETPTVAVTACRATNSDWYAVYVADPSTAQASLQALAAYVETQRAVLFYSDKSTDATKSNKTSDIFSVLKGLSYRRSIGIYSTTNDHAGAALMGYAMGANNGTANSAYTLAYKSLVGVTADDLDETSVETLKSKNANYYVVRGGSYNVVEPGVVADGNWFDEVLGIDQLTYDIQIACMDVLAKTDTKVPYTDAGALQFVTACNSACNDAVRRGFLAAGQWTGNQVIDLYNGDTLEMGYLCQAEAVADQSKTNKQLRISPPIYVCVITAGAIHSVSIKVYVE